jgi:hypothetical protein
VVSSRLGEFWSAVWAYYGVAGHPPKPDQIVSSDAMANTRGIVEFLDSGARNS